VLRHDEEADRNCAIELLADFRRNAQIKLQKPPGVGDELGWLQLAQHYGLGTRLLDWTENAAVALYFACQSPRDGSEIDGNVFILNPIDLNREVAPKKPRVFDAQVDCDIIAPYLRLTGRIWNRGRRTVAIYPIWNSERIVLQKGAFTLHGSKRRALDSKQAPSLVRIPILAEHKRSLLLELDRIGISEQTIFPELEHLCHHLIQKARLG
jgi:hypothetical protein